MLQKAKKYLLPLLAAILVLLAAACAPQASKDAQSTPAAVESAAPAPTATPAAEAANDPAPGAQSAEEADVYFENGAIYTVDAQDTIAEALAVKDDKIVFVGSAADGAPYREAAAEVVDLNGGMLLPGFTDSHIHTASPEFFDFSLIGIVTPDETLKAVEDYLRANPDKESYMGFGYMTSMFEGEELAKGPRKERLDELCPDKPLVIAAFDGHAMWLNSKAFEMTGITKDTQSPPGGQIPKDDATGELWGTLKDSAMALVPSIELPEEKLSTALQNYQANLNSMGYTSIITLPGNGFSPVPLAGYARLEEAGGLTLRIRAGGMMTSWKTEENLTTLKELAEQYNSDLLAVSCAKIFADGVMDSESALLLEPYSDNPDNYGNTVWTQDVMNEAVAAINEMGVQVHTHAIGDGGVRMALDAAEYAKGNAPAGDYRNIITHLQLIAPDDIPRFKELDIVAVPQPFWAFKQPDYWAPIEHAVLGDRAETEYPMKTLLDSGVVMAYASDYPVTSNPNPFIAIETAVTRNLAIGGEYGVPDIADMDDPAYLLGPGERVTVQDAIRGYTANGAYAMFAEDVTGTLEVGKSADMIVIDQDLLTVDPLAISDTAVLRTYLQGRLVYDAAH